MESVARSPADFLLWQQATWWTIPIAAMLFLWAVLLLTRVGEGRPWLRVVFVTTFIYANLLALGVASGFMLDASSIEARDSLFQPYYTPMHEPFINFFHPFVMGTLAVCFVLLLVQYRRAPRHTVESRRARWLALGSLFLLVGAVASFMLPPRNLAYAPKQIGDYLATAGAATISYGIARHNALEHEQLLEHDFWHSLVTVAVTVAIYLLGYTALSLLFSYALSPLAIIALSALAVLTQTPYNWNGGVFDRIMLPRWAVAYRSRLVLMRQDTLTAPDPSRLLDEAEETFGDLIRHVRRGEIEELAHSEIDHIFQYTRFDNLETLAASRLNQLRSVQAQQAEYAETLHVPAGGLSDAQAGQSLRLYLEDAINCRLCPADAEPASPERIEQIILQKKYVEAWTRTEVERYLYDNYELAVTGGAYSRYLTHARQRLADVIVEREVALVASLA